MKVTVNTTSQRVVSVLVKNGDAFQPLELDQDYQLTTPDFLITGTSFKVCFWSSDANRGVL